MPSRRSDRGFPFNQPGPIGDRARKDAPTVVGASLAVGAAGLGLRGIAALPIIAGAFGSKPAEAATGEVLSDRDAERKKKLAKKPTGDPFELATKQALEQKNRKPVILPSPGTTRTPLQEGNLKVEQELFNSMFGKTPEIQALTKTVLRAADGKPLDVSITEEKRKQEGVGNFIKELLMQFFQGQAENGGVSQSQGANGVNAPRGPKVEPQQKKETGSGRAKDPKTSPAVLSKNDVTSLTSSINSLASKISA